MQFLHQNLICYTCPRILKLSEIEKQSAIHIVWLIKLKITFCHKDVPSHLENKKMDW